MAQLGSGTHTYELIRDFLKLPAGQTFGMVSRVATDDQDRVLRVLSVIRPSSYSTATAPTSPRGRPVRSPTRTA